MDLEQIRLLGSVHKTGERLLHLDVTGVSPVAFAKKHKKDMTDVNTCSLPELVEYLLSDKHDFRCFTKEYREANKSPKAIKVYDSSLRRKTYTNVYLLATPSVTNLSNSTLVVVYDKHDADSNRLISRHLSTITVSDDILREMPNIRKNFNRDAVLGKRALHDALANLKMTAKTRFAAHPVDKDFQRTPIQQSSEIKRLPLSKKKRPSIRNIKKNSRNDPSLFDF